jgi:Uncharacterised nucleotidyltransferase
MNPTPYCPGTTTADYIELLRFSRATPYELEPRNISRTTTALNSLPVAELPVRPLIPLLYRNSLRAKLFAKLNAGTQALLKQQTLILVGMELANQQWLKKAIQSFEKNGIAIVLLKGAAFANNLYSAEAPRPGVDLDFLVRTDDFSKACDILTATMAEVVMAKDRLATHRSLFERVYVPKERSTPTVEIHRGLTNPHIFDIGEKPLWSSSQVHPAYHNEKVRVLSPEHNLLHLAVHAFRDLDFCNHNLLDAHELVCQRGVNEEILLRGASDWGARTVLYYLLHNACTLMDTPISQDLLSNLRPNRLKARLHQRILQSASLQHEEKTASYRVIQLASQFTLPDKISSALKFQVNYATTRLRDLASG